MAARECLGVVLVVLSLARRSAISGKTDESSNSIQFKPVVLRWTLMLTPEMVALGGKKKPRGVFGPVVGSGTLGGRNLGTADDAKTL